MEPAQDWSEDEPTFPSALRPPTRVLLVDDSPLLRGIACTRLRRDGYDVYLASTGDDALELLSAMALATGGPHTIDLLVIDVHMPGTNGVEVLRQLRARGISVPVLVITAFPDPTLAAMVARLGADLLAKPFALDSLSAAAMQALAVGRVA